MKHIILLLLVFCAFMEICYGACKPTFVPPTAEYNPGDPLIAQCNIQGNTDCIGLGYIVFQRFYNNDWYTALEMNSTVTYHRLAHGYTLEGRANPQEGSNIYFLSISPTILDDSGKWRCAVIDGEDIIFPGDDGLFNVTSSNLQTSDVLIERITTGDIVLTVSNTFTCTVRRVYPQDVTVTWLIGKQNPSEGSTQVIMNEYVYDIKNTVDIAVNNMDEKEITCRITKTIGLEWDVNNTWPIPSDLKTPARIESSTTSHDEMVNGLTAECTVSGDDVSISWTIDDKPINQDYFTPSQSTVNGNFAFGQTEAQKSVITLKYIESCNERNKNGGVYKCNAIGLGNTQETETHDIKPCAEGLNAGEIAAICCVTIVVAAGIAFGIFYFVWYRPKKRGNKE